MSLFSLAATLYMALFAPGSKATVSALRAGALAFLATGCALLIFVLP